VKKTTTTIKKDFLLSASLICDDFSDLKKTLFLIKKGKVDYIHYDVMDGVFVPRYGLFPEILQTVKKYTKVPVDVHLMVENPEPYIKTFVDSGADIVTVHAESNWHLSRTIKLIKETGAKVGVALNPATSLHVLDYLLDEVDLVMLMAINPGIVGHKLIESTYEKIGALVNKIGDRKIIVEIDGGVTPESAPRMVQAGANMLVCGTSTIFKQKKPLDKMALTLRHKIQNYEF
jgi:ribulose-phosphate 3-epimerase